VRRVDVGKTLLIAGVCALIPLIGNVVASFLTVWTGGAAWLVVPLVGVGVAMLTALIQAYASAPATPRAPEPGPALPDAARYRRYGAREPRGTPLALALVIGLLALGGGGWAITEGVRLGVGYVTGNEPGTDRLVQPVDGTVGGLTLKVENVWHTWHFTRVRVAADNNSASSLSLPLFGYCHFTGQDGTTLEADAFRSRWSTELPPGVLQRGAITFKGHIPDAVRQASLSFRIFGTPGGDSIVVRDIRLRPS
jgi:hypothetical protein